MAELNLAELFPGATQTSTTITIPKSALPTLTALAENRAEALFAAMVIRANEVFTTTARDADPTRSISVERDSPRIDRVFSSTGEESNYLVRTLSVNFYEPYTDTPWDADNY